MISSTLLVKAFIVGSSIVSTIVPYIILGINNNKKKVIKNYELLVPILAIIIGLFSVVAYMIYKTVKKTFKMFVFLAIGSIFGLSFSLFSNYMEWTTKLFNFSYENRNLIIPSAIAGSSLLFEFVIKSLILFM